MIAYGLAFVLGAIVGSFLNVCIHRMPLAESVVWPSSHCPRCKKRIPAYDNIPFISFLLLRGKCRFCHQGISLRYPLVELLTAFSFVLLLHTFHLTFDFFMYLILVCSLIIATFVDIKHRIIPDEVSLGGMIVGFILSCIKGLSVHPVHYNFASLFDSGAGILLGGGIIYLTGAGFDLIYFKLLKKPPINGETESMGGGDVKLLAMIGAFLGWKAALVTFLMAPVLGLVFGLYNVMVKKDHTIPYGPFLAIAAVISLFWAPTLINWYLMRQCGYP